MNIITPLDSHIPGLRRLWQRAFGDTDAFLDDFFRTAYAPERCRCVVEGDRVAAALYWFRCRCGGAKLAYLYAVATDPDCRSRGLCRALMADTMAHLADRGFDGVVLVPQEPWLVDMYRRMGFAVCSRVRECVVPAAGTPIPLRRVGAAQFAQLRRHLLPPGGVEQPGENVDFLAAQAALYAGETWLAVTAELDGVLWCPEFLGDPALAPGLVKALGYREGSFRMAGDERPFSMFRPLVKDCPTPAYFGLAFD